MKLMKKKCRACSGGRPVFENNIQNPKQDFPENLNTTFSELGTYNFALKNICYLNRVV